jgi:phage-related protein
MKTILFYKTDTGKSPVRVFLDSLSAKYAQKVTWVLSLIEELDYIPKQYFKKLISTDDLWEVRVQSGNNSLRLLGFFDSNQFVVLCHGFVKKTQKTPRKEIQIAEQRKKDYFRRRK